MDKMFHLQSSVPKRNTKNYSLGEDGYETGGRGQRQAKYNFMHVHSDCSALFGHICCSLLRKNLHEFTPDKVSLYEIAKGTSHDKDWSKHTCVSSTRVTTRPG